MKKIKVIDILHFKDHLSIGNWYEFPNGWIGKFYSMGNLHNMHGCLCFWTNVTYINNVFKHEMRFFNVHYDLIIKEVNGMDELLKTYLPKTNNGYFKTKTKNKLI